MLSISSSNLGEDFNLLKLHLALMTIYFNYIACNYNKRINKRKLLTSIKKIDKNIPISVKKPRCPPMDYFLLEFFVEMKGKIVMLLLKPIILNISIIFPS